MKSIKKLVLLSITIIICSCENTKKETDNTEIQTIGSKTAKDLKAALTLYASFDKGINADIAKGDPKLYTIMNRRQSDSAVVGLHKDSVAYSNDQGKKGGALFYSGKTRGSVFYRSERNIAYDTTN